MHSANRLSSRYCSSEIASFNIARRERRGHARGTLEKDMQALTCVAAPEVALENYIRPASIIFLKVVANDCLFEASPTKSSRGTNRH